MNNCVIIVLLPRKYQKGASQHEIMLTLTSAPMTPREVRRRYSNGRVLEVVLRNGYKKRGIWAASFVSIDRHVEIQGTPLRNSCLVSGWEATHCSKASALHTRLETCAVRFGGDRRGYTDTISWRSAGMIPTAAYVRCLFQTNGSSSPKECQSTRARSSYCSLFLLSSNSALSRVAGSKRSMTRP